MKNKLYSFRKQIDALDEQIVNLLEERMKVVKEIGVLKKQQNIPPLDSTRWQEIIKTKKGYIKKIWEIIHEKALKVESKANKTL
ncbi:MAG: chorismate mutase [Candidatus Roizmanbacteria bacterium]|nr:chorismate mutase [Candidatus Roizmanbacteria bacterium]